MNIRFHLVAVLGFGLVSHAAGPTNSWFSGMAYPPKVTLALPTNFIVVSALDY